MSHSDPSDPIAVKQSHSPISRMKHGFETLVFPSRWIQGPTLRWLDRGRAAVCVQISRRTVGDGSAQQSARRDLFMPGVLELIDVVMVTIGGYSPS